MFLANRNGTLFIVMAALLFSTAGVGIKLVPWDAMSIVGIRAVFSVVVLAVYRRGIGISFSRGNIMAAICLTGTIILFVFANKLTTAAAAVMLQYMAPIFVILIHLIFYKIKPKLAEITAATAAFLGMILFFAGNLGTGDMLGNSFAVGAGICYAGMFVCNKRADADPEHSVFLAFLITIVVGLPFAMFDVTVTADPVAWTVVALMGIFQMGLAYVFMTIGMKRTTALLACLVSTVEPIFNPLWVALATGEVPGMAAITGGAVIILSVVGYNVWVLRKETEYDRIEN